MLRQEENNGKWYLKQNQEEGYYKNIYYEVQLRKVGQRLGS